MNRTRIALLGVAAVLVAVWSSAMLLPPPAAPTATPATQLPTARGPAATPARDARPRSATPPRDVTSFDLNDAAERLHARLAAASRPATPARNPFEFAPAPAPRRIAEPAPVPVALPAMPAGPMPPPFTLTGVAEHKNGDAVERTAILSGTSSPGGGAGDIYFAKAGEQLLGRYEVTAVGADAIELRELASGQIVRLGLR